METQKSLSDSSVEAYKMEARAATDRFNKLRLSCVCHDILRCDRLKDRLRDEER
jgi:hypothetical protein